MIDFKKVAEKAEVHYADVEPYSLDPVDALCKVVNAIFEELVDAVNLELQALESRLSSKPCPDDIRDLAASMCKRPKSGSEP